MSAEALRLRDAATLVSVRRRIMAPHTVDRAGFDERGAIRWQRVQMTHAFQDRGIRTKPLRRTGRAGGRTGRSTGSSLWRGWLLRFLPPRFSALPILPLLGPPPPLSLPGACGPGGCPRCPAPGVFRLAGGRD